MGRMVYFLLLVPAIGFSFVLVSINPLKLIVEEIYPGKVEVLIDPKLNPHMFTLTPSSMRRIEKADVVVVVGWGFEEWLGKVRKNLCVSGKGMEGLMKENPHIWLVPSYVAKMARNVERCLEEKFPSLKDEMRKRLDGFLSKLDEEEKKIRKDLEGRQGVVLELRPALYHFAKEFFGGRYESVVSQTSPSLTPRRLERVVEVCRKEGVKALIVERSSSRRIALPLLRSCRLKILEVDVLGEKAKNYFEFIESVEKVFLEATM